MPKHFRKFAQQIYAGGAPSAQDLQYLKRVLGVKTIVSLDGQVAKQIQPIVKQLQMEHLVIPIEPTVRINDSIKYLQRNINIIFSSKQPLYIHCLHGSDRTGLVLAMYRVMRDGWTCQQAILEAKKYGYGLGISPQTQKSWETFLCALSVDQNAADDIVSFTRDSFNQGNVPPAFNPQQSFAPYIDEDTTVYNPNDLRWQRSQERLEQLKEMFPEAIPMVGQFNNLGPQRGFGPVENSGILTLI